MKLSLGITPRDYSVAGSVTYDADALAYFTANTAITSAADKNAINTFYLGLKSDGIYTKIKAMYLPIWGSAATSKWNLKDPRDLDAAFRLTFTTGWTYSSGGITGNGTSAYADTFLTPRSNLTSMNSHFSVYSRTNTTGTSVDLGCQDDVGGTGQEYYAVIKNASNLSFVQIQPNTTLSFGDTDSRGMYIGVRQSTTDWRAYKNNTLKSFSGLLSSAQLPNIKSLLGCQNYRNSGGTLSQSLYSIHQCSFYSMGDGLTNTEVSNLSNRVNTLMTYFGLNVY